MRTKNSITGRASGGSGGAPSGSGKGTRTRGTGCPRGEKSVQEEVARGGDDRPLVDRAHGVAAEHVLRPDEDQEHPDEGAGGDEGVDRADLAGPDARLEERRERAVHREDDGLEEGARLGRPQHELPQEQADERRGAAQAGPEELREPRNRLVEREIAEVGPMPARSGTSDQRSTAAATRSSFVAK